MCNNIIDSVRDSRYSYRGHGIYGTLNCYRRHTLTQVFNGLGTTAVIEYWRFVQTSFQVLHCNHFLHKSATYDNTLIIKVFGHAALATGTACPNAQVAQVVRLVLLVVHGQRNLSTATPAQNKKGRQGTEAID